MNEHDFAVLTHTLPEYGLVAGDMGTVVHVYAGGRGYEVEFTTADGMTVAVVTLKPEDVRPFAKRDILHARSTSV